MSDPHTSDPERVDPSRRSFLMGGCAALSVLALSSSEAQAASPSRAPRRHCWHSYCRYHRPIAGTTSAVKADPLEEGTFGAGSSRPGICALSLHAEPLPDEIWPARPPDPKKDRIPEKQVSKNQNPR